MFFHFEEVVGVGEAWIGLQRPHVKNIINIIMLNTLLLLKSPCVKRVAPHHHALAPKSMTSSSKVEHFSPPEKIVWKVRGGIGFLSHHQGHQSLISLI
jgi:hypothetical protein